MRSTLRVVRLAPALSRSIRQQWCITCFSVEGTAWMRAPLSDATQASVGSHFASITSASLCYAAERAAALIVWISGGHHRSFWHEYYQTVAATTCEPIMRALVRGAGRLMLLMKRTCLFQLQKSLRSMHNRNPAGPRALQVGLRQLHCWMKWPLEVLSAYQHASKACFTKEAGLEWL